MTRRKTHFWDTPFLWREPTPSSTVNPMEVFLFLSPFWWKWEGRPAGLLPTRILTFLQVSERATGRGAPYFKIDRLFLPFTYRGSSRPRRGERGQIVVGRAGPDFHQLSMSVRLSGRGPPGCENSACGRVIRGNGPAASKLSPEVIGLPNPGNRRRFPTSLAWPGDDVENMLPGCQPVRRYRQECSTGRTPRNLGRLPLPTLAPEYVEGTGNDVFSSVP